MSMDRYDVLKCFQLSLGYKIDTKTKILHYQKSYTPQNKVYNQLS